MLHVRGFNHEAHPIISHLSQLKGRPRAMAVAGNLLSEVVSTAFALTVIEFLDERDPCFRVLASRVPETLNPKPLNQQVP